MHKGSNSRSISVGAKFALHHMGQFRSKFLAATTNNLPDLRCAKTITLTNLKETPKVVKCYILVPTNLKPALTSKGEKVFLQRYNIFWETKDLLFGAFTFKGHKIASFRLHPCVFSCSFLGVLSKSCEI